ncbi:MAG: hydroxyacylglutathione hydrolase [Solirubrobacteraceae bacterium]|jgi:glyoxylase-like metal-dependent hydrolase (beta-lactamase superfamily II)|nr:hydroxyacylglutathione hydrolase [Solirubrobacteraceae bacterium]
MFTVGSLQENCFLVRREGSDRCLLIDPGEEADRLLEVMRELGVEPEAILLTHTHFDHIGAVAAIARATGAPVYCPRGELGVLEDPNAFIPPMFGPIEGWKAEHAVDGGERLELAGFDVDVIATPGHSPAHVTYVLDGALFSGDVLFQGSVGRTDLPGASHETLMESIAALLQRFDDETVVHPGHMGLTTLGRERATNPFLQALAQR